MSLGGNHCFFHEATFNTNYSPCFGQPFLRLKP